ncbi:putative von Willebrand factor, type A, von Willebrand factor A-like domain superfamily [Helianthus annuus]|nr:putative von Willebrand factor, type A, von Willebrand factor A-like domain superfamily [Helianthus annuus]
MDRSVVAPKPVTPMEKATKSLYPTSPMVYAVIYNPAIVDNPDMPSYQPHVHGSVYLDTAFVTMSGSWRVHCVMGDADCSCRVAIPMGEEVIYKDGEFILTVPYSFPEYVTPASKKHPKKERIQLKVNCGLTTDIACKTTSHPLKERKREPGKLDLLYETLVLTWSSTDFIFKYHAFTTNLFGSVLLKSPSPQSIDQRDMFSLYLFAYPDKRRKLYVLNANVCNLYDRCSGKKRFFIVDISESMQGNTIELTKNALIAALSKLEPDDFFGIMAFNDQTHLYSSTLELATNESLKKANEWIDTNFIASGGTNMSIALDQVIVCSFCNHYFLQMLAMMSKGHYDASYDADSIETRMQMWASKASSLIMTNIVIDGPDDLEVCLCTSLFSWFEVTVPQFHSYHFSQIYPSTIPDLCYNRPLIISGRYKGKFPEKTGS